MSSATTSTSERSEVTEDSVQVVRIERTFDAPAEDVFDAWDEAQGGHPAAWFRPARAGRSRSAEVDLRLGRTVRVVMRDPSGEPGRGRREYTEIDRPNRLVFTWTFDDYPSNQQLIELEFTERDGATTVGLRQQQHLRGEAARRPVRRLVGLPR